MVDENSTTQVFKNQFQKKIYFSDQKGLKYFDQILKLQPF